MAKDIRDYLHLYLGCEVIVPDEKEPDVLVAVNETGGFISGGCDYPFEQIKLLLRPLSDMTEEEKKELALIVNPKLKTFKVTEFMNSFQIETRGDGITSHMDNYSPEMVRYLLSKGFDLFNLIDEGLATAQHKKR